MGKPKLKITKSMRKDPRLQELWATYQERELNKLETIMLNQIIAEYQQGVA